MQCTKLLIQKINKIKNKYKINTYNVYKCWVICKQIKFLSVVGF